MADLSSASRQELAQSEDEDRSPVTRNSSFDDRLDQNDGDDTEDETGHDEDEHKEKQDAEPGADAVRDDEDASDENTSDFFPPTPRSLSPVVAPDEPQPFGLHRRFGQSSYDDYELVLRPDRITGTYKNMTDVFM